jgi:hypothetical protein
LHERNCGELAPLVEKTVTATQAKVLFAIWTLQTKRDRRTDITVLDLSGKLAFDASYVRKILSEIERMSEKYVLIHSCAPAVATVKRGRPLRSYQLNHEWLVTLPETASLLLELLSFPPEKQFRIRRSSFEEHITSRWSIEPELVHDRVDWSIGAGYIDDQIPDFLYPTDRIQCEQSYMELLAREYQLGFASSQNTI